MPRNRLSADDRRTQIIEKAAEVFSIRGVTGTRTRDIANACGINEALIYRYFESKEELYREAMLHTYDQVVKLWSLETSGYSDSLTALLAVVEQQYKVWAENPILCANIWHGIASTINDPIWRSTCQKHDENYNDLLRGLIELGIEDGSIKPDFDPSFGLWLLRGVGLMYIISWVFGVHLPEKAGNPKEFCKFLRTIMSPVQGKIPSAEDGKNPLNSA
ncbi:MAG: TetR/AcrR family transcriptional regulator [bacterium]|nr:TetR/AcrR family transcriptional regulator [bacterium]